MKKRTLKILVFLFILLIILLFLLKRFPNADPYKFKGNTLYYEPENKKPDYEILSEISNDSLKIYKIKFESRPFLNQPTTIYGLIFTPENLSEVPGIIYLPGAGETKEGLSNTVSEISKLGYAVFVIDQRGLGETSGVYLGFEDDYQVFKEGSEPIQHLVIYDALKSFYVLKEFDFIDKDKIAFMGESMGGRSAIIASAIEKKSKGVVGISTGGFHIDLNPLQPANDYLVSIDPDHYVSKISPRRIVMLHGDKDDLIPLDDVKLTFNKAKEPKYFFVAKGCSHGYCKKMLPEIKEQLGFMFL